MVMHAGIRVPVDQRHLMPTLPMHVSDVLAVNEGAQPFADPSGKS